MLISSESTETTEEGKETKKKKINKSVVVGAATAGAAIARNADGTPMRDSEGKIMNKTDPRLQSKTDTVELDKNGEPIERPPSVMGQDLPPGPGNYVQYSYQHLDSTNYSYIHYQMTSHLGVI